MVTSSEGTFAVDTVTFDSDSVQTVRAGVLCSSSEILADDRAAKDLAMSAVSPADLEGADVGSPARKP